MAIASQNLGVFRDKNSNNEDALRTIAELESADDSPLISDQAAYYTIKETVAGNIIFIGESKNQSTPDTSNAEWRIRRITIQGGIKVTEWANEAAFDQIFDNRANLFPPIQFGNTISIESDGVNDKVFHGFSSELQPTKDTAFSLSCWVKFIATPNTTSTLISHQDNGATSDGYSLRVQNSGQVRWVFGSGSGNRIQVTTDVVDIINADWHHVVATFDGGSASGVDIYVDGIEINTNIDNDNLTNEPVYSGPFQALSRGDNANDCLLGRLDQVSFYDKDLSQSEVTALYNNGSAPDENGLSTSSNLVLYWTFDGDIFPIIKDKSDVGNNLDGIMQNMTANQLVEDAP